MVPMAAAGFPESPLSPWNFSPSGGVNTPSPVGQNTRRCPLSQNLCWMGWAEIHFALKPLIVVHSSLAFFRRREQEWCAFFKATERIHDRIKEEDIIYIWQENNHFARCELVGNPPVIQLTSDDEPTVDIFVTDPQHWARHR